MVKAQILTVPLLPTLLPQPVLLSLSHGLSETLHVVQIVQSEHVVHFRPLCLRLALPLFRVAPLLVLFVPLVVFVFPGGRLLLPVLHITPVPALTLLLLVLVMVLVFVFVLLLLGLFLHLDFVPSRWTSGK